MIQGWKYDLVESSHLNNSPPCWWKSGILLPCCYNVCASEILEAVKIYVGVRMQLDRFEGRRCSNRLTPRDSIVDVN